MLANWPLVKAVGTHVMSVERVHADDTTVPVEDPGRCHTKAACRHPAAPGRGVCRSAWPPPLGFLRRTRCHPRPVRRLRFLARRI